jgi:hypothetical protein
VAVW